MASNDMSHTEIWDDSLLVDSWNEALEEYKYYHSIHARGEKVEDVLKEAENQSDRDREEAEHEEGEASDQQVPDPHAKKSLSGGTADPTAVPPDDGPRVENSRHAVSNQASDSVPPKGPALPKHLIGQVHDESLKNLLMSWYYAGYYTGLYEGQQQGAASKQA
ncbi:hypothetical protein M430DRAFT_38003 [Amorphotheca resinae ATCC 22711]|uniref:Uncharacterized protein n=1 Tax=Amorphotheca resinae ATCC 22711 TaxID=857342 RepID=A0A2T3BCR7_AMORE|nr:hypothetical protein M430DRAFT_38003 [Amorphotheca resinae ATCC 22711]PSS27199.1 hypothetical protein M430DRAFT_38003 [Amorphotheca resinae ATCC 22711]